MTTTDATTTTDAATIDATRKPRTTPKGRIKAVVALIVGVMKDNPKGKAATPDVDCPFGYVEFTFPKDHKGFYGGKSKKARTVQRGVGQVGQDDDGLFLNFCTVRKGGKNVGKVKNITRKFKEAEFASLRLIDAEGNYLS